ncbi:peroxiredoxin-like family protein [Urechidicola croceus]|uniref:thioredoxin-dependent peroxiredoxin n=1 Tax=Urechidicola croceus TaxID=1850246 RepID=A0A1D8P8E1_9FLAO|nr:peroxiredoxin-like family protein [Urechidicola croceus]AOW20830.1 antioxidant AhpC [Urechidicola croceus]
MKKILLASVFTLLLISTSFAQVAENAEDVTPLKVDDIMPTIELLDLDGTITSTESIISEQPTIFLFYRGGWCPYCNAHLAAVGQSIKEITALGYQIVGISPDSPENLSKLIDKNELTYSLYSDGDGTLIKAMGIAFKAPKKYQSMLEDFSDDKNSELLPVPSIFVVDTDGTILYEYVNPDYKTRLSAEDLIETLEELE